MTDETDHTRLVLIEQNVEALTRAMEMQTTATRDLVDAWQSAKGFLTFVQLAAKIAAAIGGLVLVVKGIGSWGK
jgi:hypothetical protein